MVDLAIVAVAVTLNEVLVEHAYVLCRRHLITSFHEANNGDDIGGDVRGDFDGRIFEESQKLFLFTTRFFLILFHSEHFLGSDCSFCIFSNRILNQYQIKKFKYLPNHVQHSRHS